MNPSEKHLAIWVEDHQLLLVISYDNSSGASPGHDKSKCRRLISEYKLLSGNTQSLANNPTSFFLTETTAEKI
jgi:hypothetical protein